MRSLSRILSIATFIDLQKLFQIKLLGSDEGSLLIYLPA